VKKDADILFDGGIRRGTDVVKALALGANFVFIGKPAMWGLHYKGTEGVKEVLEVLNEELKLAMVLTDCMEIK